MTRKCHKHKLQTNQYSLMFYWLFYSTGNGKYQNWPQKTSEKTWTNCRLTAGTVRKIKRGYQSTGKSRLQLLWIAGKEFIFLPSTRADVVELADVTSSSNTWKDKSAGLWCDFQQCGNLTSVDSDEPVQPPFKHRNSKWLMFGQQLNR